MTNRYTTERVQRIDGHVSSVNQQRIAEWLPIRMTNEPENCRMDFTIYMTNDRGESYVQTISDRYWNTFDCNQRNANYVMNIGQVSFANNFQYMHWTSRSQLMFNSILIFIHYRGAATTYRNCHTGWHFAQIFFQDYMFTRSISFDFHSSYCGAYIWTKHYWQISIRYSVYRWKGYYYYLDVLAERLLSYVHLYMSCPLIPAGHHWRSGYVSCTTDVGKSDALAVAISIPSAEVCVVR